MTGQALTLSESYKDPYSTLQSLWNQVYALHPLNVSVLCIHMQEVANCEKVYFAFFRVHVTELQKTPGLKRPQRSSIPILHSALNNVPKHQVYTLLEYLQGQ